ncbi:P-loop NTPase [Spirochaeta cellobiosiphila]|uniref:P-loop NTPase n=1 Tax=Spirochaeta cellobiosiphila TaxID=504483 RepID=UPI00040471ED|nr:P-loop NTPase [Spirochaeta cellobiosiphila]
MATKEDVLQALSVIIDPDLNKDIVSLGFVKELVIDKDIVSFSVNLTTPACPMKNHFKQQAEELVLALDGVSKVHVNMTAQGSVNGGKLEGLAKVNAIIAIASAKGGVGKSTISATIASELADQGFKVGLLDVDLYGPSLPTLFNIHNPQIYQREKWIMPIEKDGMKFLSFGFLFGDSPAIMRGPMVSGYLQQILTQVDWGELDYLLIDMPPGTGDIQLTLSQTLQLDGAVIVTTRANLSLVDVTKGILMFEKVGVPMLGAVENMSYFICDNCDKKHYLFGNSRVNLTERFGLPLLAEIPIENSRGGSFDNYDTNETNQDLVETMIRELGKRRYEKIIPPTVEFSEAEVTLKWEDGRIWNIPNKILRDSCGCALCVDEYSGQKIIDINSIPDSIHGKSSVPLGNYAVSITWSDGHSSSIYPYSKLEEIFNNLKN